MVVFDTDIIVGLVRADKQAQKKFSEYRQKEICISSLTWFELIRGCTLSHNPKKQLSILVNATRGVNVIHFGDAEATVAARNATILQKKGLPTGVIDNFIAACCITTQQILVTRNKKHFEDVPGLITEAW